MIPRTYLQRIVNAISLFNSTQLKLLLHDYQTYHGTTKDIFIQKLEEIFEAFKQNGDTMLTYHQGECDSAGCSNKGCMGYRFIGNESGNYIDLLFKMKGEDVADICNCSEFATSIPTVGLNNSTSIDINYDEQATFDRSPTYLAALAAALNAYEEMITSPPRVISVEDMQYWLSKHQFTFDAVGGYDIFMPLMKWTDFAMLYNTLNEVNNILDAHGSVFQEAVGRLDLLVGEDAMIDWLQDYAPFHRQLPFEMRWGMFKNAMGSENKAELKIVFEDSIFDLAFKFISFYDKNNDALIDKYCIYTREEFNSDSGLNQDFLFSLQFHLDKRAEMRSMGIELPLYLLNENSD